MNPGGGAGSFGEYRRHIRDHKRAGRKVVLLEFPQASHTSYYLPVMRYLRANAPDVALVVMYASHLPTRRLLEQSLRDNGFGDLFITGRWNVGAGADLYLSTNQFTPGLPGVYSVCFFHGQPSKGITFNRRALETYDAFFFYGPLHLRALDRYVEHHGAGHPYRPEIVETGYPKTDPLFDGSISRDKVLRELGLPVASRTVLYAPAFNEHASLRTAGHDIVRRLSQIDGINVLIKLAGHTVENTVKGYSTGGVDWPEALRRYESGRVRLVLEPDINPCLLAADIMVTDVSGVAYDFLALDKPVVFWDCPDFYLKHAVQFDGSLTLADCLADDSMNAGRNFGMVVRDCGELEQAIAGLRDGLDPTAGLRANLVERILFHPGKATEAVGSTLLRLLRSNAPPRKPHRSWIRDVWLPAAARSMARPLVRGIRRLAAR